MPATPPSGPPRLMPDPVGGLMRLLEPSPSVITLAGPERAPLRSCNRSHRSLSTIKARIYSVTECECFFGQGLNQPT